MKSKSVFYESPDVVVIQETMNVIMVNVSGGDIENPGDGGNEWDW